MRFAPVEIKTLGARRRRSGQRLRDFYEEFNRRAQVNKRPVLAAKKHISLKLAPRVGCAKGTACSVDPTTRPHEFGLT